MIKNTLPDITALIDRGICKGVREDNGKEVGGFFVRLPGPLYIIIDLEGQSNRVLPESVRLWTGYCDRTGRKIFDGDRLEFYNGDGDKSIYTVEFFKEKGGLRRTGWFVRYEGSPILDEIDGAFCERSRVIE